MQQPKIQEATEAKWQHIIRLANLILDSHTKMSKEVHEAPIAFHPEKCWECELAREVLSATSNKYS